MWPCECFSLSVIFFLFRFRMNFVSTSSNVHLAKMEFMENKQHTQAFLILAESKLKSWIIKYGPRESVELMLHNYMVRAAILFFVQWIPLIRTMFPASSGKNHFYLWFSNMLVVVLHILLSEVILSFRGSKLCFKKIIIIKYCSQRESLSHKI